MSTWLDTTGELNPPRDGRWKDARWLVGRHPRMQVFDKHDPANAL